MLRSRLIGRGDREQRSLVERTREKFHRDRKLVGLGPDQAAASGEAVLAQRDRPFKG